MSQLGPESRALVDTARAGDDPTSEDRARVRRRLVQLGVGTAVVTAATTTAAAGAASSAGAGTGAIGSAAAGGTAAAASASLGGGIAAGATASTFGAVALKVVAAVIIAGGVGVAGVRTLATSDAHRTAATRSTAVEVSAPIPAPAAVVAAAPRPGAPAPATSASVNPQPPPAQDPEPARRADPGPGAVQAPPAPRPAPAAAPVHASPPGALGAADLEDVGAEYAIIAKAEGARRSKDPGAALHWVDQHAARFSRGALAPERETIRILALCDLGRMDDASALARAFVSAWPHASSLDRIRSSCVRLP